MVQNGTKFKLSLEQEINPLLGVMHKNFKEKWQEKSKRIVHGEYLTQMRLNVMIF